MIISLGMTLLAAAAAIAAGGACFLDFLHRGRRGSPTWAEFFTPRQYERFVQLVEEYFRRRKQTVHVENGVVVPLGMGLQNIAQVCSQIDEKDWKPAIEEHFEYSQAMQRESDQLKNRKEHYEQIKPLLAVRLFSDELPEQVRSENLSRVDLPGTITAMVYDLPHGIQTILRRDALAWDLGMPDLFEAAFINTRAKLKIQPEKIDLGDGVQIFAFEAPNFFINAAALMLEEWPQCLGGGGTLLAVPHRSGVLTYPIEDAGVVPAVKKLLPLVPQLYQAGPGSISPRLYWYHQGRYIDLPYEMSEERINFIPPEEFNEMIARLSEGMPPESMD